MKTNFKDKILSKSYHNKQNKHLCTNQTKTNYIRNRNTEEI